jgi:NAD(P)-dependent dehydrogenase (short-subunit alcohol dehydrogenase family)
MACRTPSPKACQWVSAQGAHQAQLLPLDLSCLSSVARFCSELKSRRISVDVVVLNAGVVPRQARRTADGFEEGFQVNFLANVALLRQLLADGTIPNRTFAQAKASAAFNSPPRVVLVSSEAHRSVKAVEWATLGLFYPYGMTKAVAEYGRNKLLLTIYGWELGRRLQREGQIDVAVHALCPGAVNTGIAREAPLWSQPLLKGIFSLLFASAEKAAEPVIYLSCARSMDSKTGLYLHRMVEKSVSPLAGDSAAGAALWETSERLLEAVPASTEHTRGNREAGTT